MHRGNIALKKRGKRWQISEGHSNSQIENKQTSPWIKKEINNQTKK